MVVMRTVTTSPGNQEQLPDSLPPPPPPPPHPPRIFYLEVHVFVSGGFLNLGDCRLSTLLVPADHVQGCAPLGKVLMMGPGKERGSRGWNW